MSLSSVLLGVVALGLAYLIGSLSGSLLLARAFGRADPRQSGSGNAGATNALRTGGRGYGAAVLVFDLLKGIIAALAVPAICELGFGMALACGAAAVIGHVYPVFFGFRGGKGAATLIGVLVALLPGALLLGLAVWIATLVASGYVGLATLLGMVGVALATLFAPSAGVAAKVFVIAMTVLIFYTHRENIQRLRAGRENRFERVMWRRR
ncbi:Glycerol-3-phosphate acyltransferase protein [Salinisphaera shabanensis E1L3A]|jgi:glycerol-3-phosphate acyltransferase PlsY|uniref:Glycerol-3-phosphate acyltransferase n=1 Tax=Salinisphaera shabanensis E1L3A TaxID=1033802 RepID=U2EJ92_9GAMM|nr:glycerol-3-phosphate 1-O-acyltransferase PlsY [Salinisphaera shabanensis]ERJ18070.1 Glycerol-3-phosphate acyltransferase protein [Salinisphaera shabanensis E1L3A]